MRSVVARLGRNPGALNVVSTHNGGNLIVLTSQRLDALKFTAQRVDVVRDQGEEDGGHPVTLQSGHGLQHILQTQIRGLKVDASKTVNLEVEEPGILMNVRPFQVVWDLNLSTTGQKRENLNRQR